MTRPQAEIRPADLNAPPSTSYSALTFEATNPAPIAPRGDPLGGAVVDPATAVGLASDVRLSEKPTEIEATHAGLRRLVFKAAGEPTWTWSTAYRPTTVVEELEANGWAEKASNYRVHLRGSPSDEELKVEQRLSRFAHDRTDVGPLEDDETVSAKISGAPGAVELTSELSERQPSLRLERPVRDPMDGQLKSLSLELSSGERRLKLGEREISVEELIRIAAASPFAVAEQSIGRELIEHLEVHGPSPEARAGQVLQLFLRGEVPEPVTASPVVLGADLVDDGSFGSRVALAAAKMEGSVQWDLGPIDPKLGYAIGRTDFASWVRGDTAELPHRPTMNCWEAVLVAGMRSGVISAEHIRGLYQRAAAAGRNAAAQKPAGEDAQSSLIRYAAAEEAFLNVLQAGLNFTPTAQRASTAPPQAGDLLVLLDDKLPKPANVVHVAVALGTVRDGEPEVMSLNYPGFERLTWAEVRKQFQPHSEEEEMDALLDFAVQDPEFVAGGSNDALQAWDRLTALQEEAPEKYQALVERFRATQHTQVFAGPWAELAKSPTQ